MLQGHYDLARTFTHFKACTQTAVKDNLTSINMWFNAYPEGTVYQICVHIRQL